MRTLAVSLAVVLALSACGKKMPPADILPATETESSAAADGSDDVNLVELPALQADLVAQAGSDSVYFDTDQFSLDEADMDMLDAQARWMNAHPNVRASIEGHADERGTREYNLALGERRANAARDYLISQGVPASRLLVTSWGKERPVALGTNEEAWSQNRRAVTVVVR